MTTDPTTRRIPDRKPIPLEIVHEWGGKNDWNGGRSPRGDAMTPRRYVAFDIETAKIVEGVGSFEDRVREIMRAGTQNDTTIFNLQQLLDEFATRANGERNDALREARPLGITCAAFAWDVPEGRRSRTYFAAGDKMDKVELEGLAEALLLWANTGNTMVGWNTLGFDLDIFCEELRLVELDDLADRIKRLARSTRHIDALFHFFCLRGYMLKLETACEFMGFRAKLDGMTGADAPILWARNGDGDRAKVLQYVEHDACSELNAIKHVEANGVLQWRAKSGKLQKLFIPKWLDVANARELPEPDTSWMKDDPPPPRSKFYAWTESVPITNEADEVVLKTLGEALRMTPAERRAVGLPERGPE